LVLAALWQQGISFSHKELSDLLYAVKKAMQEVREVLPEHQRDEVML